MKKTRFRWSCFFFFLKRGYCGYEATLEPILNIRDSMQSFIFRKRCTLTTIVGTYIVRDKRRSSDLLTEASRMSIEPSLSLSLSLSRALSSRKLCVSINLWNNSIATRVEWERPWKLLTRNDAISSYLIARKKIFSTDSNRRLLLFDTTMDLPIRRKERLLKRSRVMLLTQHTLFVTGEQHVNRELEGRPSCVYTRINFHHRAGTATTNRPSVKWNNRLYDKLYFIFYYS